MASTSQRKRGRDDDRSTLDADIQALNHAMGTCGISPARDAFDSASVLLAAIRVRPCYSAAISFEFTFMQDPAAKGEDLLDLGQSCVDVCKALERGLEGRQQDELSPSMLEAIEQLTM